jgi:hypothetical protein
MEPRVALDGSPHPALDRGPSVGGEGETTGGIEAEDGPPKTDASGLQGVGKGQVAQHLAPHDDLNQTLVAGHQDV